MTSRTMPIGAEVLPEGGVSFRVWAPKRRQVEVVFEDPVGGSGRNRADQGVRPTETLVLQREADGYHSGVAPDAAAGALYRFRLDDEGPFPDPVSRFQPKGPHGPSEVVDPGFPWTDSEWGGAALRGQVIYEMHVGTFTREGTWEAARRELPELAAIGITVIELMPLADFPGRFGWGYDGVGMYAPVALYGRPEDFRRFVDDAHRNGIAVILDVVYNHVGPDGNYLKQFSDEYFTDRYPNEWGEALNFDGEHSGPVREWVAGNAAYWAREYHLDGLRLDATQQIFDASAENIMTTLTRAMRSAAGPRRCFLVAENESQHTRLVRPVEEGGYGLDGLWNDDFHHSSRVAVTGHNEAYYTDYLGKPQEFISLAKYGYLYQGQRYKWQAKRRGTPAWGLEPWQFVTYIQNHDQVANSGRGERLHELASPGCFRAVTALLLLSPGTPMLFQGQEFGSSSRFYFFADHSDELKPLVHEGRIQFLGQFRSLAQPEARPYFTNPGDLSTFEACKLDFSERQSHAEIYRLHRDLIQLRREEPLFHAQKAGVFDGAVLSDTAFLMRFFGRAVGRESDDRLLLVNFGRDLNLEPAPEPLLAPPLGKVWETQWSTEHPDYGGRGAAPLDGGDGWRIPGHAATVLRPAEPKEL